MKFHPRLDVVLLSVAALVSVLFSNGLYAQDEAADADPIEEIVVTARKVEESIQDIPLAISAFSGEDIRERSIEELEDIALFTPGLTFEDYSNGGFGTPVIRGASQFSIDALEQNVSTFIDGVYIPRQYAVDLGTVSLDRIEVVKGPQSALYGANAFLGAINYVTRKADLEESYGNVKVGVGNAGRFDLTADFSIPVVQDKLAVKANWNITELDGDWDNDHPAADTFSGKGTDEDFSGYDNSSFGFSVVAKPVEGLKLDLGWNTYSTEIESRAQTRLSLSALDLNCGAVAFGIFPRVFCGELPDTPIEPGGGGVEADFVVDPRSYSETETDVLRAAVTYDFNESFSVTYQFSNIESDVFAPGNSDRSALLGTVPFGGTDPANFFTIIPAGNFEFDSHELRLEFTSDSGLYAMLGYFRSEVEDFEEGIAGFAAPLFTTSLEEITPDSIPAAARNSNLTTNETNSIFGRIAIPFLEERMILALEGRFTDEEKGAADSTGEFTFEDDYFTPRVSLDYHLNDDNLVYASYAQGTKSGGINPAVVRDAFFQFVPLPDDERFFGPDENKTYEIGFRNRLLGGRLQLNTTAFYIDWSDLQVSVAAANASPTTQVITSNLGSAESLGVEFDTTYAVTDNLTLNGGFAYVDATYDSGTVSQRVIRAGLCDEVVCTSDGDIGGNTLPRSSDIQWNVGAQFDGTFGQGYSYLLRVDAVGQSSQFVEEINAAKIPSRTLVNLRVGISGEHWDAELWVKNLADEQYVSNAFYIASPFFVDYVPTFGNRRRFGASLTYAF